MKFASIVSKKLIRLAAFILLTGSILFVSCIQKKERLSAPVNLRCEYQANPLGLDVRVPRFSWEVNDTRRGALQTGFQILIAGSEKNLQQNHGDIWDSGRRNSGESVHLPYEGPALESQTRYFWKVRTWDAAGQASAYSAPAWWEMGLLDAEDWQGKWIGKIEERPKINTWPWNRWIWHPREISIDVPVYFRHSFKIPADKEIKSALLKTTADNNFQLFLNEIELGQGADLNQLFEFTVKSQLRAGTNLIAVLAKNTAGDICGYILSLKIVFKDGDILIVNTDGLWKTTTEKKSNWNKLNLNDQAWQAVKQLEKWGGPIWGALDIIYNPPRAAMLRKDFFLAQKISSARVYVTGLGNYVLSINGRRVGQDRLTPGWTDYPTRIQYQTYDVTSLLNSGKNAVGAVLGNLWWSSGLGWKQSDVYSQGPLKFLMQLVVRHPDGSQETVVTDSTWQTRFSPIIENTLYHGETYDARLAPEDWDKPDFNAPDWEAAVVLENEKARLVAQQGPTIQVTEKRTPVDIKEIEPGKYIFDFGQNMVGVARLKVKGPAGTRVQMRFAELLQDNGNIYTENLRRAKATDVYILNGRGTEEWTPDFTYHGFRYVELTGFPGRPTKATLTGLVFHSNPPVSGDFKCSNELLNQIQQNINWGLRGNLHSVPTDCPQRDERLGWMGDAQIFAPTACCNRNMARFFTKWQRDITDCQDEDGAVHDVNPTIVVAGPAKPAWGDAVVVVPWVVYQYYGDKRIIEENYEAMAAWVNFMKERSRGYLYEKDGYGDWVAVVPSPKLPLSAAYYYYDTVLMSKMAAAIGKAEDSEKYSQLAEKIARAFNAKYLDQKTFQYEGGTQTANLLPLAFGITPPDLIDKVVENIVQDVTNREYHLSTGFIGTAYINPMLSQNGFHDIAYKLAAQRTYPSLGYAVEKGATTIWELWNSDTQGPGMNSRNHFALGSVGAWFFEWLGGLRLDEQQPGFKHIIIAPKSVGDLTWAEASQKTLYGEVHCKWQKDDNLLRLTFQLPANTTAQVHVPTTGFEQPQILEQGKTLFSDGKIANDIKQIQLKQVDEDEIIFSVGAGYYEWVVK